MPGTGRTDNAISGHTMPTAAKIASSPTPADDAHRLADAIEREMDGPETRLAPPSRGLLSR